jgi:hypothetical protein
VIPGVSPTATPAALGLKHQDAADYRIPTRCDGGGNQTATSTASIVTNNFQVTVGDDVFIVMVSGGGKTFSTATDTLGNTWTLDATLANGVSQATALFHSTITVAGTTAMTAVVSGATPNKTWDVYKVPAGVLAANPLDQTSTASGSTNSVTATTTGTLAQAQELALLAVGWVETASAVFVPDVNVWQKLDQQESNSARAGGLAAYITASTAGVAATASLVTPAAPAWSALLATYKIAQPAAPPVTPLNPTFVLDQAAFTRRRTLDQSRRTLVIASDVQLAAATAGQAAPIATPLIEPVVIKATQAQRARRGGRVTQNLWPGYQWAGLAPVTPLVEPQVVSQTTKTAERRSPERRTLVIANRWPGYQWVGLPPVNPLPKVVVQDQAALWQELREHRRSLVIQPAVQLAAATAGVIPPPITPTKSIIVGQAVQRGQAEQNRERRTHVIQNRWPGYQWVGLPPVVPLPKTVVQDQAALWQELREHRRGEVIQPGVQLAAASSTAPPVTPLPRCIVVQARPAAKQRRVGHVITGRAVMMPTVVPARPNIVHTTITRPRRRGGAQWAQGQRFVPTGITPTLITTPATGYVSAGDTGPPVAGSSGRPGVGDTGTIKAGLSGQVRI